MISFTRAEGTQICGTIDKIFVARGISELVLNEMDFKTLKSYT